jgi:hypothetical protein
MLWRVRVSIGAMEAQQCVLRIVELHGSANNIKILNFVQKRSYDEFMTPATIKRIYLRVKCPIFLSDCNQI